MTRVLIVEDNSDLAFGLRTNLELEGYDVELASDGARGLELAIGGSFDLVVLDIMMPGMDGFEVLERFRESDTSTPVLLLTARSEETDKVRGLRTGADDYVTKPFGLMELLARIEALLRRSLLLDTRESTILIRDLEIDTAARTVRRAGTIIELAPKEYDLLVELARNPGTAVSRKELMHAVWGHSAAVVSRTVDTHVAELRRKLGDSNGDKPLIITVHKIGYRLQD